jgi:hypothetical protein
MEARKSVCPDRRGRKDDPYAEDGSKKWIPMSPSEKGIVTRADTACRSEIFEILIVHVNYLLR